MIRLGCWARARRLLSNNVVLDCLEIFARGGGFVFNTIYSIFPEVPAENIRAAFDAVAEFKGVQQESCYETICMGYWC